MSEFIFDVADLGRRASLSRVLRHRHFGTLAGQLYVVQIMDLRSMAIVLFKAARKVPVPRAHVPVPAQQEVHWLVIVGRLCRQATAQSRLLHHVDPAQLSDSTTRVIDHIVFLWCGLY